MKQKLKRKLRFLSNYYFVRMSLLLAMLVIFTVSGFYVFVGSPPDGLQLSKTADNRFVVLDYEESQFLNKKYNTSIEKAFCLYGYSREDSFRVDDIALADIHHNTETSVNFDCIDPTVDRMDEIMTEPSYKVLGTLHTHPSDDYGSNLHMSYVDAISMAWNVPMYELSGIHSGNETAFYTTGSTNDDLNLVVR